MKNSIEIVGVDLLQQLLENAAKMEIAKQSVRFWGAELQKRSIKKAVFRGHYKNGKFVKPTGNLRRSIMPPKISVDGLSASVVVLADYAAYVDKGTRYMEAQPFLTPALNEIEKPFVNSLKRLMEGEK